MRFTLLSGISTCFQVVSQSLGQIAHVLLTHPPLASNKSSRRNLWIQLARLACIRHAASVRPEPGSNSQFENWALFNLLQIICLRIDFAYLFESNNVWPAHCETLFSFQSTNLCLSDATFYILLACLNLVNKFLIFSFCLRETCLSHAATNISILAFSDSSNLLFHSFYAWCTRTRCNKSKLAYSFFCFFFPQELFFKRNDSSDYLYFCWQKR